MHFHTHTCAGQPLKNRYVQSATVIITSAAPQDTIAYIGAKTLSISWSCATKVLIVDSAPQKPEMIPFSAPSVHGWALKQSCLAWITTATTTTPHATKFAMNVPKRKCSGHALRRI